MKKYYYFMIAAIILIGMQSCEKSLNDSTSSTKTFQLKSADGTVVQCLVPSLLKAVHADLLSKNRVADAQQLYDQYDTITGYLKCLGKKEPVADIKNTVIDSSKIVKTDTLLTKKSAIFGITSIYAVGWIEDIGDGQGQIPQSPDMPTDYKKIYLFVGTTGNGYRLEAYKICTSVNDYINHALLNYDVQFKDNGSWAGGSSWNYYVGSQGQSRATQCLRIWFDSSTQYPTLHAFYIAHNAIIGWQSWLSDGATAGAVGKSLEAFAYEFLQY